MPLDTYNKDAEKDIFLKKYLDLNRYSFAIQHKLAGDTASFKKYVLGIDMANLNSKQQFLLRQPGWLLQVTKIVKASLERLGFRLTSFD